MLFNREQNMAPDAILLQASVGSIFSQALYTVIKLNIIDLLAESSKSANELAQLTETQGNLLYRLLRFLADFDVFVEDEQHRFSLTSLSNRLRSDAPASPRDWILFTAAPWHGEVVQAMTDVVITGKNAYELLYQKDNNYTFFNEKPELNITFCKAMKSWSSSLFATFLQAYDLSNVRKIVDLGGGLGHLLTAILKMYPTVHGILFDTPCVIQEARKWIENQEIADRCSIIGGNFLTSVPENADIYIISHVLLDWSDQDCLTILKNCHRAMAQDSKLLIIEIIEDSPSGSNLEKFVDMLLLLETSGRIRKIEELTILLEKANLSLMNIIPLGNLPVHVIEVVKT